VYKVTVLGFDQAYASAITGALDLFALAGVTWQIMLGEKPKPQFQVLLASAGGKPVHCINQIQINAHMAIEDLVETDLLLIPTIGGNIEKVLANNRGLLAHIQKHYLAGADIASNCSGAFFLGEAGILDNKDATTHWGYAELFKQRYPRVNLKAEKLITQQGSIFCAGGGTAWYDLALLLIERYSGHDIARSTAKAHVMDMARGNQAAYGSLHSRKYHQDADILKIQDYLENNYVKNIRLDTLAQQFNLSPRTFIRRFKQATQQSPLHYLQTLRIEAAKKLLEVSNDSLETVVNQVGYEDLSSFTRLFKQRTELSPSQYRKNFTGRKMNKINGVS
jgi:transcriptional regulator GlxA family with amidase domain